SAADIDQKAVFLGPAGEIVGELALMSAHADDDGPPGEQLPVSVVNDVRHVGPTPASAARSAPPSAPRLRAGARGNTILPPVARVPRRAPRTHTTRARRRWRSSGSLVRSGSVRPLADPP